MAEGYAGAADERDLTPPAQGMGVGATQVQAPADLAPTLAAAVTAPEPCLIEVMVDNKP